MSDMKRLSNELSPEAEKIDYEKTAEMITEPANHPEAEVGADQQIVSKFNEETLYMKETLALMYKNIQYMWEKHRGSYDIPKELDENFVQVWGIRSGNQGKDVPLGSFEYISNYGCFRMNIWFTDQKQKKIVTTEEMYVLGPDGKTRGKGKQGLQSIQHIHQALADSTGYTVFEVMTPNQASLPLFEEEDGYRQIGPEEEVLLAPEADNFDKPRWDSLISDVRKNTSFIKSYTPSSEKYELSKREVGEIDRIIDVTSLKWKQEVQ